MANNPTKKERASTSGPSGHGAVMNKYADVMYSKEENIKSSVQVKLQDLPSGSKTDSEDNLVVKKANTQKTQASPVKAAVTTHKVPVDWGDASAHTASCCHDKHPGRPTDNPLETTENEYDLCPATGCEYKKCPTLMFEESIDEVVSEHKVVVFGKSGCMYTDKICKWFRDLAIPFHSIRVDETEAGVCFVASLLAYSKAKTVPVVYINAKVIGGADSVKSLIDNDQILNVVRGTKNPQYQYDLVVIGGGSGGLAAAKEAAVCGLSVACLNFVRPSPAGSSWGLGGTCLNVGCIPKKMLHTAAAIGDSFIDCEYYGWNVQPKPQHDWQKLRNNVQNFIASLNWEARASLRSKQVTFLNCLGTFVDKHTVKTTNKQGEEDYITAQYFLIATGTRPVYPDIPGCREYCISSDDLFSLPYAPEKTVVIGGSYVALECGGFLANMGYEVVMMVRSGILRGFDRECAEIVGRNMDRNEHVTFHRPCVVTRVERLQETQPPLLKVYAIQNDTAFEVECNTVLVAVGREAVTDDLCLDQVGVQINPKTCKVLHNADDSTHAANIFVVGDVMDSVPELTSLALHAGRLLGRRLAGKSHMLTDYINVPIAIFTPLEYGCVGLSEEAAITRYGEFNLEIFHRFFKPYVWSIVPNSIRNANDCYAKLICLKTDNNRVIGLHLTAPDAGEIVQGYTMALKTGMTKDAFDDTIGIHPTTAEIFTNMHITKASGISPHVEVS